MVIDEFLENLEEIRGQYRWTRWPEIRGHIRGGSFKNTVCPITALLFQKSKVSFSTKNVLMAGLDLGLNYEDLDKLIDAVDRPGDNELGKKITSILFKNV